MDYAKDKISQRGNSSVQIILIIACIGLVAILALPIFNSLMQSGCLPYGPDSPKEKFPEPQTTVILTVLGVMTVLAVIGGYAINTGTDKLQGRLFTGILIAGLWGLGVFFLNIL